jgi:glycosyltransferase involved in cell wall biosynthesis
VETESTDMILKKGSPPDIKPFVVVGIPAFNEEKAIARVVLQSQNYADKVVVCDDGSADLTATIAKRLGAIVIRHKQNRGYGAAIQSLFRVAKKLNADVLVTLDGDGQHDPNEISKIVRPIVQGDADIVVGSRFMDDQLPIDMPWYRRTGAKFITKLTNGQSKHNSVKDAQSGFRAYNRKSIKNLVMFEDGMGLSSEILINARKQHLRIREVPSSCEYGNGMRTSTHNPVRHGVDVVMSIVKLVVEDKPLTILGLPGVLCLVVGAIFGVWMLQIYNVEHRIITNVALASISFLLLGFFALSTAITLYAISRLAKKAGNDRTQEKA